MLMISVPVIVVVVVFDLPNSFSLEGTIGIGAAIVSAATDGRKARRFGSTY